MEYLHMEEGVGEQKKMLKSFKNLLRLYLQPNSELLSIFCSYFVFQPVQFIHVNSLPFFKAWCHSHEDFVISDHPDPPSSKYIYYV